MTNQLEIDLSEVLMKRIFEVIGDTLDTARRGGMPPRDCIAMALTTMVAQTMTGMLVAHLTEDEMLQMCTMAYRDLKMRLPRARRAGKSH